MKKRKPHKIFTMLLTTAMALNIGLTPVFAEGLVIGTPIGESGLTECHPQHDENCGYTETIPGTENKTETTPSATSAPATSCTHICEKCADSSNPQENICTCQPVDSGQLVHGRDCPLYAASDYATSEMGEEVEALVDMVDALPMADVITDENWATDSFDPVALPFTDELPSQDNVSAMLNQMYQRAGMSRMAEDELETIEVDNSGIIHRPANYLPIPDALEEGPALYGLIDSNQSGPFEESDERYFQIEVSMDGSYRDVNAKLVATGAHTNVWVVDDDDFHAKIGEAHDEKCTLDDVTYPMAKDLATGFDVIYSRMTADFGPHVLHEAPYDNMPKFGDLGNDDAVNILLYDIDALDASGVGVPYVAGYFSNGDMFISNQNPEDSEVAHPIDMFHVDIGTDQGWNKINGGEKAKLQIYGTLAHEFQHMLFYAHFGIFPAAKDNDGNPAFPSQYYDWFNESLSGLADIYYTQPGAEIIDIGRTGYAAGNLYEGSGYGDLFIFNSSMKNYGMGYLFSALFHNYTDEKYAQGVYDFFDELGNDTTLQGFYNKFNAVNNSPVFKHPFNHIGAMLNSGLKLGATEVQSIVALNVAYQYFMNSFAADGGLNTYYDINGNLAVAPTQKLLRGTERERNLWALRPELGAGDVSFVQELPTLSSGDKIIIDSDIGYSDVTRDMLYKLEGDGEVINITIPELAKNKTASFYLALVNPDSATGADIYTLLPDGFSTRIVTNGREAYLFADTFISTLSKSDNITATYVWSNTEAGDLEGAASIDNATPRIGDTLNGSYTGVDIATPAYQWIAGKNLEVVGSGETYTVTANDLGAPIILSVSDSTGAVTGNAQAITAQVKKRLNKAIPAAPIVQSSTHNSVTLNTIINTEYSNGGEKWQTSSVFNGLSPDTSYTFYCRTEETTDTEASTRSLGTAVSTDNLSVNAPTITAQPMGATYQYGDTVQPLTITASSGDSSKLSYRWYKNTINATTGGILVANTATASYTPTVRDVGTTYYYCVVSKTVEGMTENITSDTASVTIEKAEVAIEAALDKTRITAGDDLPIASIVYSGVIDGESLIPATGAVFSGMPSNSSVAGTYTIIWSNSGEMQDEIEVLPAYANYTATYTDTVTFTIESKNTGGGGSSGGGNSKPSQTPNPKSETTTINSNIELKAEVDGKGNATVTVSDKNVADAIKEAQKRGTEKNGIVATITSDTNKTINSFTVNLPLATLGKLINAEVTSFTIDGGATITFDLSAIKQIKAAANADVTVTAAKVANSTLSKEAQAATGGRPVYDFKVTGDGKTITTFNNGKITLSIPYEPQKVDENGMPNKNGSFETSDSLVGVYIDENGKFTYMQDSGYNAASKTMRISTTHLSVYGVGYKTKTSNFTDTANHWAKDDIAFVTERGLFTGTTSTTFSPNDAMTRGMFVTALGRLAKADVSNYKASSFSDVAGDSYYLGYVEWAVKNSITNGVGDNKFAPDQSISRQEMAVMLQSYAKSLGYKLPSVHKEIVFTDNANISTWAKAAVKEMQMAGILMGNADGKFEPMGLATRAEVSAMLHRFVEIVENSETAED